MKFKVEDRGDATVLAIHEKKIDLGISAELKAEFLLLCKPRTRKKLILDLTDVQFCDSSGLSALLIADRTMRAHGGMVHLVHLHQKIHELLKLSQLDRIFTINKSVAEALKA